MTNQLPGEVEVLVVGYGPVGAAVACLLGQYGVRTLVIDKARDIFMAPRAIALDNEALRILQLAGVSDDAFAKVAIPYVRMRCPLVGDFGRIDSSGTIDDHPKLVTFYQPELERALRKEAERHASVAAATGVELERFVDDGGAIRAVVRTDDGVEHTIRARYLVGADGACSKVRAAIGQELPGKTYAEDWLIVDARGAASDIDHVEFLCDHRRPTPHMVAPGGRTRWEFMLQPGETREEMERDETIRRLLAPWAGGREMQIERKAVYRFHARCCQRFSRGSVFLVGDAAHLTPPFVGQGLVAGLRDAANLSWKLAWVLRGRAGAPILETYDQERRPHALKMIALARHMGQLIMPRNALMAVLVHGTLKLARRFSAVRKFFDELDMKPKPAFARGLFVKGRGGRLRRGGLLPQVRVRTPAGDVARSDDVLGPHLALVGLGADAQARLGAATRRRWEELGGRALTLVAKDEAVKRPDTFAIVEGEIAWREGWCAVVRPDRTILHDGPAADAERVLTETIFLLGAPDAGARRDWVQECRTRAVRGSDTAERPS